MAARREQERDRSSAAPLSRVAFQPRNTSARALALGYLEDEAGTRLVEQADRLVALCDGLARSRN